MKFLSLIVASTFLLTLSSCKKEAERPDGHLFKVVVKDMSNNVVPGLVIDINLDGYSIASTTDETVPGRYEYYYYFEEHDLPTAAEVRFYTTDGTAIGRSERVLIEDFTVARVIEETIILRPPSSINVDLDNSASQRTIQVFVEDRDDPNGAIYDFKAAQNYPIVTTINHVAYGNDDYVVSWDIFNNGVLESSQDTAFYLPTGGVFNLDLDF